MQVPQREGCRAALSGGTVSSTQPDRRGPPHLAVFGLGLTPGNSGVVFTDVLSGVFSTAVVERAGNGTAMMFLQGDGWDPRSQSS